MSPEDYLIHELAKRAQVSVRTIRYYIDEGLLPAPDTKGRYASYSREYLDRLELIRRLKEAYLPLKEIRERVSGLTGAEVKQMLQNIESEPPVLNLSMEPEPPHYVQPPVSSALDYINQILDAQNKTAREERPATPPRQIIPHPVRSSQPPSSDKEVQSESWQRISLSPGLELHIRQPVVPELQNRLQRLIAFARSLFSDLR